MKERHLKLFVAGATGRALETVWWGGAEESTGQTLRTGARIEMAYTVEQRRQEIGIRIALGAGKSSIFRLIVGQAMMLVGISLIVGLAGAFAATRLLNSLLFGVGASDPVTFIAIVLLVSAVAFIAAWLPARRATRVDPIIALRAE